MDAQIASAIEACMTLGDDDDYVQSELKESSQNPSTELIVYDLDLASAGIEQMEVRSKAEKRISAALRSPFHEREVQAKTKFTLKESQIFLWSMTTYELNEDNILYDDDVVMVTKREFCSLLPHTLIEVGVINAWASYLNNMEEYKALSSSRRLFFTTYLPECIFVII
ncbi:uncharacterized protein LOC121766001 [Salvia splendens]|uniref:uncharacterized protein LOC121766001 n=1 Tax=Salvia splendens TaxID=180675 RepID=UPI001C27B462|nr:uncharacterized protein LOC121766001 [Salvia splendens]